MESRGRCPWTPFRPRRPGVACQRSATAVSSPASAGAARPLTRTSRSPYSSSTVPALPDPGEQLARGVRDLDVDVDPERGEERRDLRPQRVQPVARSARLTSTEPGEGRRRRRRRRARPCSTRSALLNATSRGLSPAPSSSRTVWTVARCSRRWGSDASTTSMQDVGPVDLLERRPERVDELVRQLVDEAHGVGDDRGLAVAELDLARGRVERREQLVLGPGDLAPDERVQERRLAGVRVADDADRRHHPPVAAAGGGLALLADLLDPLLHLRDPGPDDPAVGLELALARSPRADAALGPRQVGPELASGAAAGTRAGRARPGAGPRGSGRAGRRCRGSAGCGR